MLNKLESLLNSEVKNGTKSQRTATEYVNVARKLVAGDFTDENIPSKARWLQISAVLSYLKDYELISESENFGLHVRALKKRFRGDKTENQKVKDIESKIVTDAQFDSILSAMPNTSDGQALKLACEISRNSGLRMSEVLSLTPANIEQKADSFHLTVTGKRGKPRTAYLPVTFAARLERFQGFIINQNYMVCTYRRITRALGLQTSFHALRHTYATECTAQGVDVLTLASILGHEDVKTTMIYSHVKKECPQQLLNLWKNAGK